MDPGVPAWELTLEAQAELLEMDEPDPQVEVYWTGDALPPYHRSAHPAATALCSAAVPLEASVRCSGHQAVAVGVDHRLHAVAQVELGEDA